MEDHNQRFIQMWGKERARGKWMYILLNTIIFFVLLNIVTAIFNFRSFQEGDFSWFWDIRRLLTYLAASVLIVMFRWRRNERLYKNFTEESN